ncbi:YugN family protein [Ureibacillus chungkukjangi]|uniref:YugN-like protein n=1 Tax=Ureibacillus chungkukjangi TaxID=1202712 RepID=A0A318TRD5_9BACL|nr:YugN family protein [Ureibacillus chungkukjangi]MCM3389630.1 YugN-like family protein [Ureibacillus chungkukjangi]PYF06390.1 YugN-like protein [Ureibacillus chungkukjangi]
MLQFESELDGKQAQFGYLRNKLKNYGFCLGGYWDYDRGFFDAILSKQDGETIYLRLPFVVISGVLDSDNAYIQFKTPFVIKHIVNYGLDYDESSLLDATGFSQFQTPVDKDGKIENKHKWVHAGEQVVGKVLQYIN